MKNSFVYFIGGSWDGVRKTVDIQPQATMYVMKMIEFDLVSASNKEPSNAPVRREQYDIMAKDYFEPSGGEIYVYKYVGDC